MGENIFVGILCVIALAAAVWGWWIDNGGSSGKKDKKIYKKGRKILEIQT